MRKIREILYLKWVQKHRHRHIARALGVSIGIVTRVLTRAGQRGLDWPAVEEMTESALEVVLYGERARKRQVPLPEPVLLHEELKKPGVTLALLHEEYLAAHPEGYSYSEFCRAYARWRESQTVVMHQEHRAGEKMFTDFSGKKPCWVDPGTGEVHEAELFVAVLGASNYTYAEAVESQKVEFWIGANTRAVEFYGGVPVLVVPDQLKSAVSRACAYEPGIQRSYQEWGHHYATLILPARPRRPRDKAKVEVAVQIVQRWIVARLRHFTFFSLVELNEAIRALLFDLNARRMRRYGASRRELYERLDLPHLKPLPERRFECARWEKVKVGVNYHVEIDKHFYSVPYQLIHHHLWVRVGTTCVEIYGSENKRITAHVRKFAIGRYTTKTEHMPRSHRAQAEWTPERMLSWARKFGPCTTLFIENLLGRAEHPEHAYRACLGVMRLGKEYGAQRLENAAVRAVAVKAFSYRHVANILKNNLDRLPKPPENPRSEPAPTPLVHENIRGNPYYE
jgi:transposase